MDTNKNGSLEWTEFIDFCKKATPDMTEEEVKADWTEMDLNADSKVSTDELFKFLKRSCSDKQRYEF